MSALLLDLTIEAPPESEPLTLAECRFGQPHRRIHVIPTRPTLRHPYEARRGISLCGTVIHPLDLFADEAGPRVWASRPEDRCGHCERIL